LDSKPFIWIFSITTVVFYITIAAIWKGGWKDFWTLFLIVHIPSGLWASTFAFKILFGKCKTWEKADGKSLLEHFWPGWKCCLGTFVIFFLGTGEPLFVTLIIFTSINRFFSPISKSRALEVYNAVVPVLTKWNEETGKESRIAIIYQPAKRTKNYPSELVIVPWSTEIDHKQKEMAMYHFQHWEFWRTTVVEKIKFLRFQTLTNYGMDGCVLLRVGPIKVDSDSASNNRPDAID